MSTRHEHPMQALERLAGLLESPTGSVVLTERGDDAPLPRHPGFRLLAAMNPATDAGAHCVAAHACRHGSCPAVVKRPLAWMAWMALVACSPI